MLDGRKFTATSEGTPQGGVISPLLANIALHGLEHLIEKEFPTAKNNYIRKSNQRFGRLIGKVNLIRYADDFVVICEEKAVVQRCREIIAEWLYDIGLELKPEKTRLTHTLYSELSEDGVAGFEFLGFHIQQYPAGIHHCSESTHGELLGFKTLITPTKKASKVHLQRMADVIRGNKSSPQAALIKQLNPIIRGWSNYYQHSDGKTTGEFARQDYLLYQKLRRWAKSRCKGSLNKAHQTYWHPEGSRNWVFSTLEGKEPFWLLLHSDVSCSSNDYVKVKGDRSLFDGDLIEWSKRMGRHPEMPNRMATLLKQQKGKCSLCGQHFKDGDILEVDHIVPKALRGRDEYENLQLLHRHCHDTKTRKDSRDIAWSK